MAAVPLLSIDRIHFSFYNAAMRKLRIVGLLILVAATIALEISWQRGWFKQSTQKHSTSLIISPAAPKFLTVSQAPAVDYQATLNNSFVLPKNLDPSKVFTVVTTGDIIPARGVALQIQKNGIDYPLAGDGIKPLLSQSNLTIVDLESPLMSVCPPTDDHFQFCGPADFADAMARAGIDVATLENNHIGNYGNTGVDETEQHLTDAGIRFATSSKLDIEKVSGQRIGILAFNGVGGHFNRQNITEQIQAARPQVDILMVAFHWGKEYELEPIPDPNVAPDDPKAIGRLAADAGADLIIGNHPHQVQGFEIYKGKFVEYALGNFVFDQSWSVPTQQGVVATYTFYGSKLLGMRLTPVHIYNQARPAVVQGEEEKQILGQFRQSSQLIATASATPK